jgi:hypothetical protein
MNKNGVISLAVEVCEEDVEGEMICRKHIFDGD